MAKDQVVAGVPYGSLHDWPFTTDKCGSMQPILEDEWENCIKKQPPFLSQEEVETLLSEDAVNHPSHYTSHPSGIECIEVTEHYNFCIGNAIKYLWRAGLKGGTPKEKEDCEKAIWYIKRHIESIK